jgi:hypothetical protein
MSAEELKALKESLQKSISYLPADALIGLITYGRMIEIHELNVKNMARSYVFKVGLMSYFKYKKIYFMVFGQSLMYGFASDIKCNSNHDFKIHVKIKNIVRSE